MSLLMLVLTIAIVGFLVWLVLQIPMPGVFHNVIIGVVCVVLVLWLLQKLGVVTGFSHITLK